MATFQNPGAFFVGGTLVPAEQRFIKTIMMNAQKNGYTKFVEPCAGAFAMSHLAKQAGYKPSQIESSDVAMFTSIMGYAIMGKPLGDLEIHAKGFTDEDLADPAVALYARKYLKAVRSAGSTYGYEILLDLEHRKAEHIQRIRTQLDRARESLGGMNYRPLDMWKHLEECYDDPHALVIANPPTYTAGFEKWYDTGGRMTWKEPEYGIFDPATGLTELYEKMGDAKCLLVCYPTDHDTTATREIIKLLKEHGNNVQILTKGDGRRDFDLLDENDWYGITISTADNKLASVAEPYAIYPSGRLISLLTAKRQGIKTWVSFEPVIDTESVLEMIRDFHHMFDKVKIGKLNYHPSDIDWAAFGHEVEALCQSLELDYYIKDSLREIMDRC